MPTETFLRLPEEKRARLVEAAWEEFLRVPFEEASINKIVLKAHIPRGSFYQYFADKQELFFYLLGDLLDYFYAEYTKILKAQKGDIFKTQVCCFDRLALERHQEPLLLRGVEMLQQNPELLMQAIIENQMGYGIWEAVQSHADLTAFYDAETAKQTFILSLMALVMKIRGALAKPERAEHCRGELLTYMDILKHGSLKTRREGELYE